MVGKVFCALSCVDAATAQVVVTCRLGGGGGGVRRAARVQNLLFG